MTGETKFILEQFDSNEAEAQELLGRFVGVSFAVSDIAETYRKLQWKGVEFRYSPERQFWGGLMSHFLDPDGNILTLLQEPNDSSVQVIQWPQPLEEH